MSESEETPAQRQARIRRQKREAKINANATERLDKITRLSGRTPESMRKESSPSFTPPGMATPPPDASPSPLQGFGAMPNTSDPAQMRAQEEFMRSLLRGPAPGADTQRQGQGQGLGAEQEDPMMKMLSSMLGGIDGNSDPNTAGGLPFSPDDISKATGLPPFVTNMMMGGQKAPPSPAAEKSTRIWKAIHVVFSIISGLYLTFRVDRSISTFGENPPAPATIQNPFLVFVMGELMVQGARIATAGQSGKSGLGLWIQMLKEFAGDGAIMVFMLGLATWWKGLM